MSLGSSTSRTWHTQYYITLRCEMSGDSALYVFITEQPMVNLKGLYNIMQLSRCLLTHYIRTHQWQLEFLWPNVDFFSFWKWVSYPSGHNLPLWTSNWKCNNTKHSNTKLHGPTKLKSEPKKTWPPNFLLSLQTPHPPHRPCVWDIDTEHLLGRSRK
jgi:hypothetical protein